MARATIPYPLCLSRLIRNKQEHLRKNGAIRKYIQQCYTPSKKIYVVCLSPQFSIPFQLKVIKKYKLIMIHKSDFVGSYIKSKSFFMPTMNSAKKSISPGWSSIGCWVFTKGLCLRIQKILKFTQPNLHLILSSDMVFIFKM